MAKISWYNPPSCLTRGGSFAPEVKITETTNGTDYRLSLKEEVDTGYPHLNITGPYDFTAGAGGTHTINAGDWPAATVKTDAQLNTICTTRLYLEDLKTKQIVSSYPEATDIRASCLNEPKREYEAEGARAGDKWEKGEQRDLQALRSALEDTKDLFRLTSQSFRHIIDALLQFRVS